MIILWLDGRESPLGIAERKSRERIERVSRITAAARQIATEEGWPAVTVRRLAEAIEYSQPVLYSHFENRDAIVAAVAVEGFRELAIELRKAAKTSGDDRAAIRNVAMAYIAFATDKPALYEAMFTMPTSLRFAQADTKPELREAFAALAAVVKRPGDDVDTATETFWAALHGLAELEHSGRIRPAFRNQRVALAINGLLHY